MNLAAVVRLERLVGGLEDALHFKLQRLDDFCCLFGGGDGLLLHVVDAGLDLLQQLRGKLRPAGRLLLGLLQKHAPRVGRQPACMPAQHDEADTMVQPYDVLPSSVLWAGSSTPGAREL